MEGGPIDLGGIDVVMPQKLWGWFHDGCSLHRHGGSIRGLGGRERSVATWHRPLRGRWR
jgi:hypothetical protein